MSELWIPGLAELAGAAVAGALAFFTGACRQICRALPRDERLHFDPLPRGLRLLWPLVKVVAFLLADLPRADRLGRCRRALQQAGWNYLMTPIQLVALQWIGAGIGAAIVSQLVRIGGWPSLLGAVAGLVIGYFWPMLTLRERRRRRERELVRALPDFLDYLTMTVQGGMNFSGALQQVGEKGPAGALRQELLRVRRDVAAGMSRADALRSLASRLQIREINAFAGAVIQAERSGSSLGDTLRIQADQRRTERFQRAEKLAMQAPVKLIFPLVIFIFPMTFLVLGFPIAMKLIHGL